MPFESMIFVATVIGAFAAFGITLAFVQRETQRNRGN